MPSRNGLLNTISSSDVLGLLDGLLLKTLPVSFNFIFQCLIVTRRRINFIDKSKTSKIIIDLNSLNHKSFLLSSSSHNSTEIVCCFDPKLKFELFNNKHQWINKNSCLPLFYKLQIIAGITSTIISKKCSKMFGEWQNFALNACKVLNGGHIRIYWLP